MLVVKIITQLDAQQLALHAAFEAALCYERALEFARASMKSLFKEASILLTRSPLVYEWAIEALRSAFPLTTWAKKPIAGSGSIYSDYLHAAAIANPQLTNELKSAIEHELKTAPKFVELPHAAPKYVN